MVLAPDLLRHVVLVAFVAAAAPAVVVAVVVVVVVVAVVVSAVVVGTPGGRSVVGLDCGHCEFRVQDTLPEWSKGVDSSSTSASCVGSNPTGVNLQMVFQSLFPRPREAPRNTKFQASALGQSSWLESSARNSPRPEPSTRTSLRPESAGRGPTPPRPIPTAKNRRRDMLCRVLCVLCVVHLCVYASLCVCVCVFVCFVCVSVCVVCVFCLCVLCACVFFVVCGLCVFLSVCVRVCGLCLCCVCPMRFLCVCVGVCRSCSSERIYKFPTGMSDLFVLICSCGRRLTGIIFGFTSVALALHKVGRSSPFGIAMRMEVAKRSGLSLGKLIYKKNTNACSNIKLYHLKDLSFLYKKSIGFWGQII